MWRSKSCPKCDGDIFVEMDCVDGEWYEYCLQCSYRHYLPAVARSPAHAADEAVAEGRKVKRRRRRGKKDVEQEETTECGTPLCSE